MKKKKTVLIVVLSTVIAMAIIGFVLINSTLNVYAPSAQDASEPGEFDDFAKCLAEKGVSMAGAEWCSACQKQKRIFGEAFSFVDFKDCDKEREWCLNQEIQYYPTWIFSDGRKVVGIQSIEKLSELSGCGV